MKLPPIYQINIEEDLSNLKRTIFERLLPSFNSIEDEAKSKAEKYLEEQNKSFNPDIDDPATHYENANDIEISHSLTESDFRQHFINSCTIYLYHLFEKKIQSIFKIDKKILSSVEKEMDKKTQGTFSTNPDWLIIRNDLSLLSNSLKHDEGRSFKELENNYQQYFKKYEGFTKTSYKPDDIFITEAMLNDFFTSIENVWATILPHYVDAK